MSYQIRYDSNETRTNKNQSKKKWKTLSIGIIIAVLFCVFRFSHWDNELWDHLIPGNADITKSAFRNFTESLRNGEAFSDAVYVFCDTVLEGAAIEK